MSVDSFELPDSAANSDFVLSQPWYEARDRCWDCFKLYKDDLERRNARVRATGSWDGYYTEKAPFCTAHRQTLAEYLQEVRSK